MTPLVSVITPSIRPHLLERSIELFKAQDYPNKELIIIPGGGTIGEKRNRGCEAASGEIILHMDDDDYYSPDWIKKSVAFLTENNLNVTGLASAYFYDKSHNKAWLWSYDDGHGGKKQPYVCEATMCYRKSVWQKRPFQNRSDGEGIYFIQHLQGVSARPDLTGFVANIHGDNSSSQDAIKTMKAVNPDIPLKIITS